MSNKEYKKDKLRVCYFGIYNPEFSRNKVYIHGLRENGVSVIECNDRSPGLLKYWRLFRKHWDIRNTYDVLIVGYPGHIITPFAKLISRKPIILDALCSLYEGIILSRDAYKGNPFRIPAIRFIDWLAYACADKILVETEKQKEYFIKSLGISHNKCTVVYTGVDDTQFFADANVKKFPTFTALFRGRIVREAGMLHVLKAAKILEEQGIKFLIIGYGWNKEMKEFDETLKQLSPKNVEHIREHISDAELRQRIQKCHISLGQFGDHERLSRTIPHKAFESLAMRLPYVTARAEGIKELLTDGKNCLLVNPADPVDLAQKIKELAGNLQLQALLAEGGYQTYLSRFTPRILGREVLIVAQELINVRNGQK